jgi:16S rRNA (cytosine967-C5)-methyltransferase
VIDFLDTHSDMKIAPINSFALAHAQGVQDDGSVQLWTHQDQSDAMFMVLFEKAG